MRSDQCDFPAAFAVQTEVFSAAVALAAEAKPATPPPFAQSTPSRVARFSRTFNILAATVFALAVALAAAASPGQLRAADDELTPEAVRAAIADAVAYLVPRQNKVDGSWTDPPVQVGGVTSLVTLALLSAGESPQSPPIRAALAHLESIGNPKMTYATALQTMVFCAADPKRYQARIAENARWLESTQTAVGPYQGAWAYSGRQGTGDNSNAQFALLGLYEAERVGVKIDPRVWRSALDYWSRTQRADGAWGYTIDDSPSGSMTCAGISSLIIASGQLEGGRASVDGDTIACCGGDGANDVAERIERGMQWLGRHFRVDANPSAGGLGTGAVNRAYQYYYLYGVERVGRLSGRRYLIGQRTVDGRPVIQPHDWYREGAAELIARKDRIQNCWVGAGLSETNPIVATSFALLFLSKGRRPIVISQLRHGGPPGPGGNVAAGGGAVAGGNVAAGGVAAARNGGLAGNRAQAEQDAGDWNSHPTGVPRLTRRVEQRWKRDLTWQTIDIRAASAEDMAQSPVLFLSGRGPLSFTATQREQLKRYVSQGGFLFVEACNGYGCDGAAFDRSFRELLEELFPDSKLRLLPPDHPVWFAEERVDPAHMRPLYGLDTCCRTSIVYCPETLSCAWELYPFERDAGYPANVNASIEAAMRIGTNVLAYATNRELKDKLDRPLATVADLPRSPRRGALAIPKLNHGGGADEAVNAWPNFLTLFARQTQLPVEIPTKLIAPVDDRLADHPIVFMHGRRAFRFSADERAALARYLRRGGFLFADAICASEPFNASLRTELKAVLPEAQLERLPANHPLFTTEFRGYELAAVTLRDPDARDTGDPLTARKTSIAPVLEVIRIDGRIAVVLSPYDISCALENHASLDCKGYIPPDAAKIAVNVLLFALQQ